MPRLKPGKTGRNQDHSEEFRWMKGGHIFFACGNSTYRFFSQTAPKSIARRMDGQTARRRAFGTPKFSRSSQCLDMHSGTSELHGRSEGSIEAANGIFGHWMVIPCRNWLGTGILSQS